MAEYGKRSIRFWIILYLIIGGILYGAWYVWQGRSTTGGMKYGSTRQAPGGQLQQEPTVPPQTDWSRPVSVTLDERNGSGQSGTATLSENSGKVLVVIQLSKQSDAAQPAHIHAGDCPGVGLVRYPLTDVTGGLSETVLKVTLEQLTSELPLAINVHKSKAEASVYTSCGEMKP